MKNPQEKTILKHLMTEEELIVRCQQIEGMSFSELAILLNLELPIDPLKRKGWLGTAVELALGTTAGTKPLPDFDNLGIELKTIPINLARKPIESTFITSISLLTIHQETWLTSQCFAKLKKVLWLPIEGDKNIPFTERRIGRGFLWSPSKEDARYLQEDWQELTFMIGAGQLEKIDATYGKYLQVRPKAANAKSLCYGFDEAGNKIPTLPRGFYLRTLFTAKIMDELFTFAT
ncbi:MAG: DNA mismatch repair endonuclease MutH [Proteobacteria bacterium]|nr:DNA mismatch repair endonuclease MutH [Pseudomonadota bacterium]